MTFLANNPKYLPLIKNVTLTPKYLHEGCLWFIFYPLTFFNLRWWFLMITLLHSCNDIQGSVQKWRSFVFCWWQNINFQSYYTNIRKMFRSEKWCLIAVFGCSQKHEQVNLDFSFKIWSSGYQNIVECTEQYLENIHGDFVCLWRLKNSKRH